MTNKLIAMAVALGLGVPALGAAKDGISPVKLTDAQLDEVTAGVGPPAFVLAAGHGPPFMRTQPVQPTTQVNVIIDNVQLTFNVGNNSPVNLATTLQLAVLSQSAQTGSATALQAPVH